MGKRLLVAMLVVAMLGCGPTFRSAGEFNLATVTSVMVSEKCGADGLTPCIHLMWRGGSVQLDLGASNGSAYRPVVKVHQ